MKILFLLAFFISFNSLAQDEHAWVFFKDKPGAQQALNDPSTILSPRAIERKLLRNTTIDERDVPVNEAYISRIKEQEGIEVKAKSKWLNCIHVIGTIQSITELTSLEFVSKVEFASKNIDNRSQLNNLVATDKLDAQINFEYGPAEVQIEMIGTDFLHEKDFTGEGMIIAVMDAGFPNVQIMESFERLRSAGKLLGGYNFPDRSANFSDPELNNHGTLVLATMAGYLENRYTGTAPDASYYLFRTEIGPTETPVEESYWVEAAERADSLGVDIINTSLGYTTFDDPDYDHTPGDMDGKTTFISRGAGIATEKGLLVVTSAGNRGDESSFNIIGAPADADVLSIGAVDGNREYAFFSSVGPTADGRVKPDLAVQGLEAVSIDEFDNIVGVNGTSFSSPIMAGSAASLWQVNPSWTNRELMQILRASASLYEEPSSKLGFGIPNLMSAFIEFQNKNLETDSLVLFPNPVEDILNFSNPDNKLFEITIFDTLGKKVLHKTNVQKQIDLTGFSRGIYIIMFEGNNNQESLLIIKE